MPKVGWVTDHHNHQGRQFSVKNFRDTVPEGIEIVDIDLTQPAECDLYIVHAATVPKNLPLFPKSLKPGTSKLRPVIMYAYQPEVWSFGANAVIYQSPLQASQHKFGKKFIIPPPIVDADWVNKQEVERQPKALWCGNATKEEGFDIAVRWAETEKTETHFFGALVPKGSDTNTSKFLGWMDHENMPEILHSYQKLIYFPRETRPFDRVLAEALLCGVELEVWGYLGIESFEEPLGKVVEMCQNSTGEFWGVIQDFLP